MIADVLDRDDRLDVEPMNPNDDFRTPMMTPLCSPATTTTNENADLRQILFEREYEKNMLNFIREIQRNDDVESSSTFFDHDESDLHGQQATEASDGEIGAEILQSDPSCPEEVRPADEKCSIGSPLMCQKSLCVPYTNNDVEVTNEKEKLCVEEPMTNLIVDFTDEKNLKENFGHIMISYNHSTQPICLRIAEALRNLGFIVWIDQDNMTGNVFTAMASAIENASVVLIAVNEEYSKSRYCRLEAEYATERNKSIIPMSMQNDFTAGGWLGLIIGGKLYVDFAQMSFEQAFHQLIREIEPIRSTFTDEKLVHQTKSSLVNRNPTTNDSTSFNSFRLVQQWNNDDVMEWLRCERLEIFQNVFSRFTGESLRQLYKIRSECPKFYHQTVASLVTEDEPSRLFYILTLNSALESLFSPFCF